MSRRIRITLVLFLMVCLSLFLTGCFDETGLEISCNHDYKVVSSTATCEKEGDTTYKCDKCGREITIHEASGSHVLEVVSETDSTCSTEGKKVEKCTVCEKTFETVIEKKDHTYGEWVTTTEFADNFHDEQTRECSVCHEKETRLVSRIPEMDTTILDYDVTKSEHVATSLEEAAVIYNAAILNNASSIKIKLDFDITDFNTFFNSLSNLRTVPFDFNVESNYNKVTKNMTLTFTYYNIPTKTTPKTVTYVQAPSVNASSNSMARSADYDDFAINSATKSYSVSTSEQLVYALEHRVKPIPLANSEAEKIYNKIKVVLRQIINDTMTTQEKVKAIHDWLVINVIYDQELVGLMNESDVKSYNGFYLEGVFNDGYAVCEGISKAMCAMANIEGIPCVRISGHETGNADGIGHAWNKIYVDGDWYIIDATSDGTIINGTTEILSYAYYLISETTMQTKYIGEDYTDYECTKDYDVLANTTFINSLTSQSFVCSNQVELNNLIKYFTRKNIAKSTVQFKITFDYGDSYGDEVQQAFLLAGCTKNYGFVNQGDYILIMFNE